MNERNYTTDRVKHIKTNDQSIIRNEDDVDDPARVSRVEERVLGG